MSDALVRILDGNTFVVSDARGDIEASPTDPTGLFSFDTRFLSHVGAHRRRRAAQRRCRSTTCSTSRRASSSCPGPAPSTSTPSCRSSASARSATASTSELTILNHDDEAVDLDGPHRGRQRLRRPVRGQGRAAEEGHVLRRASRTDGCVLGYERETFARETVISAIGAGRRRRARPDVRASTIEPHGEWTTDLDVVTARSPAPDARTHAPKYAPAPASAPAEHGAQTSSEWLDERAAARVRLGAAEGDLPAQPRRPRRAALLAADRRAATACPPRACPGS